MFTNTAPDLLVKQLPNGIGEVQTRFFDQLQDHDCDEGFSHAGYAEMMGWSHWLLGLKMGMPGCGFIYFLVVLEDREGAAR